MAIQGLVQSVDQLTDSLERKWGVGRLRLLVEDAMRERFDRQWRKWQATSGCWRGRGRLDDWRRSATGGGRAERREAELLESSAWACTVLGMYSSIVLSQIRLFRARILGLSDRAAAERACDRMRGRGACAVVAPGA